MRFGVIGTGSVGQIRVKALKNAEGCELVALADVVVERARCGASSNGIEIFDDYQEMLASNRVDAVIVSTPPQLHEEMVVSALDAGKHVLCEKPLSNSVDACRRMVEASRKTGKTLATGFNHLYFPAVQLVKRVLDGGVIGELDHVRAFAGHTGLSEFKAPWMYDQKVVGGGTLMDNGIHLIDLTRYLLGEIDEVFGIATGNVWKIDGSEDNGLALMRNPQGKTASLHATWSEWKGYRLHVEAYGEKGMARAFYAPMMSMVITLGRPGGPHRRKRNFYPMNIIREKLQGWQSTVIQAFREEHRDFRATIEGRGGSIASGFDGFRAVEMAAAARQSSDEGRSIRLCEPF